MILDVRRLGLSLAAVKALFFGIHYLGMVDALPIRLCPAFYNSNAQMPSQFAEFVMADFLSGLILAALWGYVFGALVAVVYNRVGR